MYRDGTIVQAWRAAVWVEVAVGHLGVTDAQASFLAQVERGVLIGQSACRLLTFAREVIDCKRAGISGSSRWDATETRYIILNAMF